MQSEQLPSKSGRWWGASHNAVRKVDIVEQLNLISGGFSGRSGEQAEQDVLHVLATAVSYVFYTMESQKHNRSDYLAAHAEHWESCAALPRAVDFDTLSIAKRTPNISRVPSRTFPSEGVKHMDRAASSEELLCDLEIGCVSVAPDEPPAEHRVPPIGTIVDARLQVCMDAQLKMGQGSNDVLPELQSPSHCNMLLASSSFGTHRQGESISSHGKERNVSQLGTTLNRKWLQLDDVPAETSFGDLAAAALQQVSSFDTLAATAKPDL
jgi:hypothetical protein